MVRVTAEAGCTLVGLAVISALLFSLTGVEASPEPVRLFPAVELRGPIALAGCSIGGNGTFDDPRFVRDCAILVSQDEGYGVLIYDTEEHWLIDNVSFRGSGAHLTHGVGIRNASNVRIERSLFEDLGMGIEFDWARNVTVAGNRFLKDVMAISCPGPIPLCVGGYKVRIIGNEFTGGDLFLNGHDVSFLDNDVVGASLQLHSTENVTVEANHFLSGSIRLTSHVIVDNLNVTIARNVITDGVDGIWGMYVRDVRIEGNTIARNSRNGIYAETFYNATIANNTITGNGNGTFLWLNYGPGESAGEVVGNRITRNRVGLSSDGGLVVHHNHFVENGLQAFGWGPWAQPYPNGGNCWSDYAGEDRRSGPDQDQPGSDGIGDTPYDILSYDGRLDQDPYPLMASCEFRDEVAVSPRLRTVHSGTDLGPRAEGSTRGPLDSDGVAVFERSRNDAGARIRTWEPLRDEVLNLAPLAGLGYPRARPER